MNDIIDINAGTVISGEDSIESMGEKILSTSLLWLVERSHQRQWNKGITILFLGKSVFVNEN